MLRLCYESSYCRPVRSRIQPATQRRFLPSNSLPMEPRKPIRPSGVVAAIVATVVAVPVLLSNGADGSGQDMLAISTNMAAPAGSTSVPESTSSSLFGNSGTGGLEAAALFQAGAQVEVPSGETAVVESTVAPSTTAPSATAPSTTTTTAASDVEGVRITLRDRRSSTTEAQTTTTQQEETTSTTAVRTTQAPTTAARPTTAVPVTASPTTTATPATTAVSTTQAPATTTPTTAAPTTQAPATTAAPGSPTADQWAALRNCESGGNYSIVSSNGLYHGAYQFGIATWDGLASAIGRNDLVGVAPSAASAGDQDAMALALWHQRGAGPWPHCGKYLP